ncbi:MAG: GGDEF domain-containing protein [Rhodocyclaceae bacterium]|nr:GGDEF domain-containing protein [Rhodocyclaceae bacterium]
MRLRDTLLWQPGAHARLGLVAFAVALAAGIGHLHALTGLGYEFHVFFIAPVLLVAWWVGKRAGYGLAILAAGIWFLADRSLAGEQADSFPLLFNSATRLTIFLCGAWLMARMHRVLHRESRLAREDALTRLPNRRAFHERGRRAFAQAQRQAAPLTAIVIDLDRFKEVNDSLGHIAGDRLLATVAQVMLRHVRASDIPGRLGGDEFALLLPNMDASAAAPYSENLRQHLLAAMREQGWPVTFSIGVASYRQVPRNFDVALAQADALMYEVKNGGRDRILQRVPDGESR